MSPSTDLTGLVPPRDPATTTGAVMTTRTASSTPAGATTAAGSDTTAPGSDGEARPAGNPPPRPNTRPPDDGNRRRWWSLGLVAAALALAVVLVVGAGPFLSSGRHPAPGIVTLTFDQPADAAEQAAAELVRPAAVFPALAQQLAQQVWLPHDVEIRFATGNGGAAYDATQHVLAMPYGFVAQVRAALATQRPQQTAADLDTATVQATAGVVLHEIGHVLVEAYRLPVLGGEEVVADTFAATAVRLVGDRVDGLDADLLTYADFLQGYGDETTSVDLFDDHLPAQLRAARLRCLVYGSDPAAHADLAGSIPAADQPYCAADFTEAHDSWVSVLQQYRQT